MCVYLVSHWLVSDEEIVDASGEEIDEEEAAADDDE